MRRKLFITELQHAGFPVLRMSDTYNFFTLGIMFRHLEKFEESNIVGHPVKVYTSYTKFICKVDDKVDQNVL